MIAFLINLFFPPRIANPAELTTEQFAALRHGMHIELTTSSVWSPR